MRENAYRVGTTVAPAVASLPGAVCQEQTSNPTTMTTSDYHPHVSVRVEPDDNAATASTGQLEHSVKRAAASDSKPEQQGACTKCQCKCSCIARLKSRFYSFKLSIAGKVVFSLFAFLVPYDVVTDVIATWELYSSGHSWWGTMAVVICYMSLRFMFLFELMMQKEFLGLKHFCWIGVDRFQVPGRVSSIFWLYLPFSILPLFFVQTNITIADSNRGLGEMIRLPLEQLDFYHFTKFAVFGLLAEILLLFMVPFLSPPVLMYGVYRAIKSVWEEDHQDWYLNPVGTQTSSFYAVVAMALEAVSEALPELVLQTRVFLASDPPLLSPFLYYQSMSLSLVSIIKAAIVFYLSLDMLKYTITRLGGIDSEDIEKKLTNLVHFLNSKNTDKSLDLKRINLGTSPTLIDALVKTLKKNTSVKKLNLKDNNIGNEGATAIAKMLENNTCVTSVNLGYNKIGSEGAKAIADMLGRNSAIKSINVAGNSNIKGDAATKLAQAAVEECKSLENFSGIPIAKLKANDPSITELVFGLKDFGDVEACVLGMVLQVNTCLTSLKMYNNEQITDKGWAEFAKGFAVTTTLEKLILWGNEIGDAGAGSLAEALKENTSVLELNLAQNGIGNAGAMAIAKVLEVNKHLTSLNMSYNPQITDKGWAEFAKGLAVNMHLTSLNMSENKQITGKGWVEFAKGLAKNTALESITINGSSLSLIEFRDGKTTSLDLTRKGYGNQEAIIIAALLQDNNTLESLNLGNNNIGHVGVVALAKALENNTSVKELNLRYNNIGNEGATAIAKVLEENNTLQKLVLFRCGIDTVGVAALAEGLKENKCLLRVDLEYNSNIGLQGKAAIGTALQTNKSLVAAPGVDDHDAVKMGLQRNRELLFKGLANNTVKISALDLSSCGIDDATVVRLGNALKKNRCLLRVDLRFNDNISQQGKAAIGAALQFNKSLVAVPGVDDHDAVKMGLQRNRELLFEGLTKNTMKISALDLSKLEILHLGGQQ